MKVTIEKCSCDHCGNDMTGFEYEKAPKVIIRVELPNPEGGCGQVAATEMYLCKDCSEKIGIINTGEYHKYTDSQNRLRNSIRKCKNKILELCFNKKVSE